MTTRPRLLAFIDEAGQRSSSASSSDHFTMSAVAWKEEWDGDARGLLHDLRQALGRQAGHQVHFVKLNHHDRLLASKKIGDASANLVVLTVTVCKRHLTPLAGFTDDMAYLWCLRLLLERLSWLARDQDRNLDYTMAHVVRFKKSKLRAYEQVLRNLPDCQVAWAHVPKGGSLSTPGADERLQLADISASATFQAFEPIKGFTERRYLGELNAALYRRKGNLLSYGLKVVPTPRAGGAYEWATRM